MGKKIQWVLHAYGGKQSLEIEDSQNKIRNISMFHGSLKCLSGFVLIFF